MTAINQIEFAIPRVAFLIVVQTPASGKPVWGAAFDTSASPDSMRSEVESSLFLCVYSCQTSRDLDYSYDMAALFWSAHTFSSINRVELEENGGGEAGGDKQTSKQTKITDLESETLTFSLNLGIYY